MQKTLRLAALGLSLAAILAACSSSGGASPSAAAPSAAAPSAAAPSAAAPSAETSAPPASAATGTTIALADTSLGKVVVDGAGRTLYMFTPDEDAGKPTCYDQCAESWPAFTADAVPTAGAGLDASKLKLVDRTDGTKQVMYGDYTLYYFSGDSAAGDTNGQGVGTKWYVVGADAEPIKS